jgi:hypothetical protein
MVLAGLVRIDLPRVKIEYSRCLIPAICLIEQPTGEPIGKEAEIASARGRHVDPTDPDRSQRYFNYPRDGGESGARCTGAAIEVVFTWIHAGAIEKSFL